jgi:hypothetical protein
MVNTISSEKYKLKLLSWKSHYKTTKYNRCCKMWRRGNVDMNMNCYNHHGKQYGGFSKKNIYLPYFPANLHLSKIYKGMAVNTCVSSF